MIYSCELRSAFLYYLFSALAMSQSPISCVSLQAVNLLLHKYKWLNEMNKQKSAKQRKIQKNENDRGKARGL